MLHPDVALRFINDHIGYGLFATAFIPRGTAVWVLDPLDQFLSRDAFQALPAAIRPIAEKYSYVESGGSYVLCWDEARYMNHSCRPALRGCGEAIELAVRDLQPGDEVTCEYGTLNLEEGFECACGAPNCRGTLQPDDIERFWQEWDAEAAAAFAVGAGVPQPLLPYLVPRARDGALAAALAGGPPAAVPSCRTYRVGQ